MKKENIIPKFMAKTKSFWFTISEEFHRMETKVRILIRSKKFEQGVFRNSAFTLYVTFI